MHRIRATPRHGRAIAATAELLRKVRLQFIFLSGVARSAWLGQPLEDGSIEVLALMSPEQKNQVAMMASHRGFRVDREEVEATEELDLIPLNFLDAEGEIRVHVLVASNALYGRMVPAGPAAEFEGEELRVAAAEDLALFYALSDERFAQDYRSLAALPSFDRAAFNRRLQSIGLPQLTLAE